jgi:AGZA family xanthine/uracil permease-like MFS transporter
MAYIIVVNPAILKFTGLPVGASTVATLLVAAIGSLLMGIDATRPIAVAPHVGENRLHRVRALGAVFLGGVVFPLLSFAGLRTRLANAVLCLLYSLFGLPH